MNTEKKRTRAKGEGTIFKNRNRRSSSRSHGYLTADLGASKAKDPQ